MKVITMESSAFTALTEQIAEIAAHVRAVSGGRKEDSPDRLLTTREAAHLLNVSCRTLQRMRSEQRIAYVVLRGKCRYRQSEIDRLLEDNTVTGDAATPEQLKRNHTLRTVGIRGCKVFREKYYPQGWRFFPKTGGLTLHSRPIPELPLRPERK